MQFFIVFVKRKLFKNLYHSLKKNLLRALPSDSSVALRAPPCHLSLFSFLLPVRRWIPSFRGCRSEWTLQIAFQVRLPFPQLYQKHHKRFWAQYLHNKISSKTDILWYEYVGEHILHDFNKIQFVLISERSYFNRSITLFKS